MDQLKLDAESLNEMKAFYQEELAKAVRRIDHINKVLEQLGESGARLELHVGDPTVSSKRVSTPKRKYKKKRGPKSKWDKVIVKSLKQADKPLTYDELTDYLMISEGRSPEKRSNTKATVQNTIFKLRKDKKVQTFSLGSRIKYIALNDWTEGGEVTEEFKSRVTVPKVTAKPGPKPKKRGPGRPPKKRGPGRPKGSTAKKSTPAKSKKTSATAVKAEATEAPKAVKTATPKRKAKPAPKKKQTSSAKKEPRTRKVAQRKTVK